MSDARDHDRTPGWRTLLTTRGGRLRLLALLVGGAAVAALVLFLRPAPARLAAVVGGRLVADAAAGPESTLGQVLADAGVLRVGPDGAAVCAAPVPSVVPGPCGARLSVAVAELCTWDPLAPRPPVRVACVADDGLLRLTLGGLGGAPPGPPGPPGPPVTLAARDLPDGTSLLPPLLAILLAVVFRHVLLALGAAVWLGATLAAGSGPFLGVWLAVRDHVVPSVVDNWLMFLFTVSLMGMVSVLVRGGGVQGLVDLFSRRARGARSTQAMTAAMGTAVFFDDYANSLIVGAAARPLTDARRISREKLSFLVDATSAPIAGVALISTWIGIELQFLAAQLEYVPQAASAYDLFLQIVPFRFYCFLTLGFVWLVALSGRDFGPMLTAERRARRTGAVLREGARPLAAAGLTQAPAKPGAPTRWANAVVPILLTITTAFGGFLVAGYGPMAEAGIPFDLLSFRTWRSAFVYGGDDSAQVLAVAGLVGSAAALLLVVAQRILGLGEAALAWLRGVWAMRLAFGILVLAIAIRGVTEALDTAPFLVSLLHAVPPVWLPLLSFLLAAAVAFATGTSWGTMGILLPVVVPLVAHQLGGDAAAVSGPILLLVVASVLDGAIFGDHCSPISDTTVLSSLASAADHIDHVRTQAPYALVVMVVAGGLGYLLVAATGLSALVVYPAGLALLAAVLFVVGRRPEA